MIIQSRRRAAPVAQAPKLDFTVLKDAFIDGPFHAAGSTVRLTEREAKYWLRLKVVAVPLAVEPMEAEED